MSDIMNPMELGQFIKHLREDCQLAPDSLVLLGVSGGPDSLCLLDAFRRAGQPLIAAHFDHGLRPESAQDAQKVEAIARQMGVPFVKDRQDVRSLALEARLTLEEAARTARYRFLFEQARRCQAQAVAVAHTADDQVETLLMHLLRGTGLDGLKGMAFTSLQPAWDAHIPLIRPLLGSWREETVGWCLEHGLDPVLDASNQDTRFFRNRIRHELIPELQTYNPQVKEGLWRTAQALAGDAEVLKGAADEAWQTCRLPAQGGWLALDCACLAAQPLGLQRAVLRLTLRELDPGLRDIDFGAVERGLALLQAPGSRRAELSRGWVVIRDGPRLLVGAGEPPVETEFPQGSSEPLRCEVPGQVALENGWVLRAEWARLGQPWKQAQTQVGMTPALTFDAWFDSDQLSGPFTVRCPAAGERFAPLGLGGHTLKLSDLFINQKVPQRARPHWPLLAAGEQVVWVVGLRQAEPGKVSDSSQHFVHFHLQRAE